MPTEVQPTPDDTFTLGLWTVGNIGRNPFGEPVPAMRSPEDLVRLLDEVGTVSASMLPCACAMPQ